MPARDINFGDATVHFHFKYMSEHSDAEYETMRKAFLRLGEDYGKLQYDYDKLLDEYSYTAGKPKLYNLILNDDFNGQVICLFKPTRFDGTWFDYKTSDTDLKHNRKYQFTKEEIDECNKSVWIKNLDLNDYKVEVSTDEG